MHRFKVYIITAVATFTIGVGLSHLSDALARFIDTDVEFPGNRFDQDIVTGDSVSDEECFVISMADDGELYFGKYAVGSIMDTRNLRACVTHSLFGCQQQLRQQRAADIAEGILKESRCDSTVYIVATESMRFGEVEKLIDVASSAGAKEIGLVVRRQRSTR